MTITQRFSFLSKAACALAVAVTCAFVGGAITQQDAFATEVADQAASSSVSTVKGFSDVNDGSSWYFSSVYRCSESGIIKGYSAGTFGPSDSLTRAQAAVILWRIYSEEASGFDTSSAKNETGMPDVEDGAYYTGAANWAVANGVINGKKDEAGNVTFDPNGAVTREQLCAIIANVTVGGAGEYDQSSALNMPDGSTISDWALSSVAWALDKGVISGSRHDGVAYADPNVTVNRATMATILINSTDAGLIPEKESSSTGAHWIAAGDDLIWFTAEKKAARECLLSESEVGFWAYATSDGTIVRAEKYAASDGNVYLADADGKLLDAGWHETADYDNGETHRYYVEESAHACVPGASESGYAHVTLDEGYVATGCFTYDGNRYKADSTGKLATSKWVVTGDFTNGSLQRYWAQADGSFAKSRLVTPDECGYWAYATGNWYVARGKYTASNGNVYLADNEGKLADPGWKVTGDYTDGALQRYYIDADAHACVPGYSTDGYAHYTLPEGYVMRHRTYYDGYLMLADNDGLILTDGMKEGWVVTDKLDGAYQRYYLHNYNGCLVATIDFFEGTISGKKGVFFGREDTGYVLRGTLSTSRGVLLADNDGFLVESTRSAGWMVATAYDEGRAQRYYLETMDDGHLYAKTGLFEATLETETESALFWGDEEKGYVVRGTQFYYDGAKYLSDETTGKLTVIAGTAGSGTRDPYIAEVTWSTDSAYLATMRAYASQIGSETDYFIAADYDLCRVTIMQKQGSSWIVLKTLNGNFGRNGVGCAGINGDGINRITTKRQCDWDDFYFGKGYNDWACGYIESYSSDSLGHLRWNEEHGGYEDFASIHSTGYTTTGWGNTGCIGLLWDECKWIYDTIPYYTTVYQFSTSGVWPWDRGEA